MVEWDENEKKNKFENIMSHQQPSPLFSIIKKPEMRWKDQHSPSHCQLLVLSIKNHDEWMND